MTRGGFPGEALRERREARCYSLRETHAAVRVPIVYIEAMEEGRVHDLPGRTYAIGFIETYCEFLDLNPEPFVDRYRAALRTPAPTPVATAARPQQRTGTAFNLPQLPELRAPEWMGDVITWGAICGFLLLAWLTYASFTRPIAHDADSRVDAGTFEVTPPPVYHFDDQL